MKTKEGLIMNIGEKVAVSIAAASTRAGVPCFHTGISFGEDDFVKSITEENSFTQPILIMDCPGHADYIKNMITGGNHCDGHILVCDEAHRYMHDRHTGLGRIGRMQEFGELKAGKSYFETDRYLMLDEDIESKPNKTCFPLFGKDPSKVFYIYNKKNRFYLNKQW